MHREIIPLAVSMRFKIAYKQKLRFNVAIHEECDPSKKATVWNCNVTLYVG